MREDEIKHAILELPGNQFEKFARELLSREQYPALISTSTSRDLGEDAVTSLSLAFLHGGKKISLLISKTATWDKLKSDCERCRETGRQIDIVIFVAVAGDGGEIPTTQTTDEWRKEVVREFGWEFEARTLDWLAPFASRPQYEDLADNYLGVPPPDGDYFSRIQEQFQLHTTRTLQRASRKIPGISDPFPRPEVNDIEERLAAGCAIVLSGEAGTGKSGIGAILADNARRAGKTVLFVDARRLAYARNESDLRQHFDLRGSIASAIRRAGDHGGCRVIMDQLDNIAGTPSAELIADLLVESGRGVQGVERIAICRNETRQEQSLLKGLLSAGFTKWQSQPIGEETVRAVFAALHIDGASPFLVEIARNLLNLELVGEIRQEYPDYDFANLTEEAHLWEKYLAMLRNREGGSGGEALTSCAASCAQQGLNQPRGDFYVALPIPWEIQRLHSWKVIVEVEERWYRFCHETLQDYIYARDAAARRLMPLGVAKEIPLVRTPSVLGRMSRIYQSRSTELYKRFVKELLNVS